MNKTIDNFIQKIAPMASPFDRQQPALLQKSGSSHNPMWFSRSVLRVVGTVVIAAIANLTIHPLAMALSIPSPVDAYTAKLSPDRQLVELIDNVRATLMSPENSVMRKEFNPQTALGRFDAITEKIRASMQTERDAANDPLAIARLDDLKKQFDDRGKTFRGKLQAMVPQGLIFKTAKSDGTDIVQWLNEVSPLKVDDLTEMPFQRAKADPNNAPRDFTQEEVKLKALESNVQLKNASFTDSQYLGSKAEAELTTDIRSRAASLGNNALNIYNWVRNNVEWQPTWGGQQTADMTLDVKRGNAMDIATLTIALLRAASIPARYVHGTVDIPPEQFKNMAGDFESLEAASDFVASSGVRGTAMYLNGSLKSFRIEHVWVEAALPYYPSQGTRAASTTNPIDTWVPMDPSYKLYDYMHGMDAQTITTIANIDGEQLANNFINSGTVNEQEGWVQGLNSNIIAQAQEQAQKKLEEHINGMQNPTVGDVIGGRSIRQQVHPFFPSSLPYPVVVRGNTYSELPDSLRVRVTLGLGWDRYSFDYNQSKTYPLYQLNQRSIAISFKPATTADTNALRALVPENLTDLSQLPSFLPSSIRVIPEIKRDNEVLLTSGAMELGESIDMGYVFQTPTKSYLNQRDSVIAGSYLALGVVGSNPSQKAFNALRINLEQTKQILETGSAAQKAALTRERLVGDRYVTGILGYYSQFITQSRMMGIKSRTTYQSLPMAGSFGYEPSQRTLLGINRGIESHGVYMNVRLMQATRDRQGDSGKEKQLTLQAGMLASALEHSVPEQMFTDPDNATKPEGFSTAKALGLAMAQGQKIYTINQQNRTTALTALRLDSSAMSEINNALASGKEITAHTDPLIIAGYRGSGYAITDPVTGEGAYKISGGKNGGFLTDKDKNFIENLLAFAASLPDKYASIFGVVLTAYKAYQTLKDCDSAAAAIIVGSYAVLATLIASLFLGAVFLGFGGGLILALALTLIAVIISALLIVLMEAVANGPTCNRNEG
jgi:hypothetical protein